MSQLRSVSLDGAPITDAGLDDLKGLVELETLNLDNTAVGDAGIARMARFARLEHLSLDNTRITDAGLVHLAGLTRLRSLFLQKTAITDAGLTHLKGLRRLDELWLYDTRVTDAGVNDLRKALPKVDVNYYAQPYSKAVAEIIEDIRSFDEIDGTLVGPAAIEGPWHKLAVQVLQKGTGRDFKLLLKEENPHAQAVGLYCLARSKQPDAAPILKRFLSDKSEVGLQEVGCIVRNEKLGTFAARLLHDANYLERRGPVGPLMEPQEIAAIHIPPLADDCRQGRGYYHSLFVHWLAREQPRAFTLSELQRAMPKLRPYQIVKGIGRSTASPEIRRALVQWLNDRGLDETTRLAAASGLTRDPDPAAQKALESARGFLQGALGRLGRRH